MQAVVLKDAFDAATTDDQTGLHKSLRDDRGGSVGIQKTMANDLPDQCFSTTRVVLGSGHLWRQAGGAVREELLAELEVALPTETEFLRRRFGAEFAFAFEEHGQTQADRVIVGNGKRADGTLKSALLVCKVNHRGSSVKPKKVAIDKKCIINETATKRLGDCGGGVCEAG